MNKVSPPYRKGPDAGWWVRWTDPATGRRRTRRFTTKREAGHYSKIMYYRLNADVYVAAVPIGIDQAKDEFMARYDAAGLAAATKQEAKRTVERFIDTTLIHSTDGITQAAVDHYLTARRAAGLSPYTTNKDAERLRTFVRWAVKQRYLAPYPAIEFTRLKTPPPVSRALSDAQISSLLTAAPTREWGLRLIVGLCTGLRKHDLYRLRRADVDLAEGRIRTTEKKTRKAAAAIVPDALCGPLKTFDDNAPPDRRHFWQVINLTWLDTQFRAFRPAAAITIQSLRKTYASRIESIEISTATLNHTSAMVTRKFYTDMEYIRFARINQLPVQDWLALIKGSS